MKSLKTDKFICQLTVTMTTKEKTWELKLAEYLDY